MTQAHQSTVQNPLQAVQILDQATQNLAAVRADHVKISDALNLLYKIFSPQAVPVQPAPGGIQAVPDSTDAEKAPAKV